MKSKYLILDKIIKEKTEFMLPIIVMSRIRIKNIIRESAIEYQKECEKIDGRG